MSEQNAKGFIARFRDLPTDSVPKTVFVAVSLCLVASMIVSAAAVSLRPVQEENRLRDKQLNVLQVAGAYQPDLDVAEAFAAFEPRVLELASGEFTEQYDAESFEDLTKSDDPAVVRELAEDPAGIGSQLKFQLVYLLRNKDGELDKVILPIKGYGLWSTLYGFIALNSNGNDIYGLQFYQHGETPGLGAEVDNPRWKALWRDKKLFDESGVLSISVAKAPPPAGEKFHIDALAGATLTSSGVDNLVRFWMGEQGYGPFLKRLQAGAI
ncbi:MAG: Na(+)-translocating NADH-quinone reductase subunit C [Burkholderiaceae bacterium]